MANTKKEATKRAETKSVAKRKKIQAGEPITEEAKVEVENKEAETVAEIVADERDNIIAELREELERQRLEIDQLQKPQVIVTQPDTERVHFLWMANVADDNVKSFGEGGMYGRIVGKTGNFFVPKNEMSRILDEANRRFIDNRNLIIISGLSEEEREMLGVNYKEGELLDVKTFRDIAKLPHDLLVDIYKELCEAHQNMVAERFNETYKNAGFISRQTVLDLNSIHPSVAFKDIIEHMNAKDAGED